MGRHYDVDEEFANVTNADIEEIEVERPTLISYIIDESGSMSSYSTDMQDALQVVKDTIQGSKEADEMRISVTRFSDRVTTSGYQEVENIDTQYSPGGCTKLYDAIVGVQKALHAGDGTGYMEQLKNNGNRPKAVVFIFTDGYDNYSDYTKNDARNSIELLKKNEIAVGLIEFGSDAHGIAQELGILEQNIKPVNADKSELRKIMMATSKSAISASKSANVTASDSLFDF